jgi:hypothetical protein
MLSLVALSLLLVPACSYAFLFKTSMIYNHLECMVMYPQCPPLMKKKSIRDVPNKHGAKPKNPFRSTAQAVCSLIFFKIIKADLKNIEFCVV